MNNPPAKVILSWNFISINLAARGSPPRDDAPATSQVSWQCANADRKQRKLEAIPDRTQSVFVFLENTGTTICTSVVTLCVCASQQTHTHRDTCAHTHAHTVGEGALLCSPAVLSDCSVCWATAAVISRNHSLPRPPHLHYWLMLV